MHAILIGRTSSYLGRPVIGKSLPLSYTASKVNSGLGVQVRNRLFKLATSVFIYMSRFEKPTVCIKSVAEIFPFVPSLVNERCELAPRRKDE
jgi:hypothetical protein